MPFFSWATMASRDDTSVSTHKRKFRADPDYPSRVPVSPGRVGFPREQAERYDEILVARQLEAAGRPSNLRDLVREQALAKGDHERAALYAPPNHNRKV